MLIKDKIKSLFKILLALLIVGCLVGYLIQHWDQLRNLAQIQFRDLLGMYLLCLVQMALTTIGIQRILFSLGVRIGFGEMFMLHNATIFLNYAPMQFGTLFRAAYLKKQFKLGYTEFAAFFLYLMLIMLFCSALAGAAILIFVYHLATHEHQLMAILFGIITLCSAMGLFCPLPKSFGKNRLSLFLTRLVNGRNQITRDYKSLMICVLTLLISFCFVAGRLWWVYHCLGQSVNPFGFMLLGSLGYVAIFVSLTPGGLGIRELILAGGAVMLSIPFEVGTYATLIDRAVLLSFTFIVGGISTLVLWRRSHLNRQMVLSAAQEGKAKTDSGNGF